MNAADNPSALEGLSALVDGEAGARDAAALSAAWRDDADLRARWHRYHLIGDVMRSEELAGTGRDAAFLAALRARLADEPVVLAPAASAAAAADVGPVRTVSRDARAPQVSPSRALRRWAPPAALAAGFMVVAIGGVALLRGPTVAADAMLAREPAPQSVAQAPVEPRAMDSRASAALPAATVLAGGALADAGQVPERATGVLIRSARLDQYLAAHKQFGGSSALGAPSGFLRNATHEGPAPVVDSR